MRTKRGTAGIKQKQPEVSTKWGAIPWWEGKEKHNDNNEANIIYINECLVVGGF